ncbi:Polygalacturonase inhibitor protein [Rhynchospora pubera]|uniref:Polygalacturonase inhibitor protein n=1 Tax=Rhynchospora pubera TaxID=906938 RepID=A0AAV8C0B9_9POAL|nr:Polygalacturonase inhibitor protein [Rhynchospora pubera]
MSIILLLLFLLCCNTPVLSTKNSDETALLKIKQQLGDPPFLSSWVKGFNFCDRTSPAPDGYIYVGCTNTSRVDDLVIRHLINFTAPFPEAICGLTKLRILVIYQIPGLYGQIPSCITKLFNLNQVLISETSVSGRVPHFYNNSNLDAIILASNNLSHSIPPSLSTLPILTFLNLSSNHLTGTIPKSLVNVWGFDVGNNQLHGDASFLFSNQSKAGIIVLANNSFKFDLSYVEFSDNLYEIDLSHNKIYGKVPASFATAVGLYHANLSFNRLCGELPQGGIMGRFSAADFANNRCLCGYPLPPCSNSSPAPAPAPA